MPSPGSATTNAAVYAVAERAVDLIRSWPPDVGIARYWDWLRGAKEG